MNTPVKPVVVFGNQDSASTTYYYLSTDSDRQVVAFTVDQDRITNSRHDGLPVVPFELIQQEYPPDQVDFLFPAGFQQSNPYNTNIFRRARYEAIKSMGYQFINYISSRAMVADNVKIGDNVLIYEGAIVQPFVEIGNNNIIRSGVNLGHHVWIKDHCFIAAEVTVGSRTCIGSQTYIGLNTTVLNSVNIADGSFIASSTLINRDTQEFSKNLGIPGHEYR
jgi:sugar O-acyltransferase (sialic acid O-acetyltransferase NeuD family)